MSLQPTAVYEEILRYTRMAAVLQDANISSPTGRDVTVPLVDDQLCQWVTIYDCVERRFAGFSNALQQVRLGSANPKQWQAAPEFDGVQMPLTAWLYVYLLHRVTGSGASFSADHGFRNSIVADAVRAYVRNDRMPDFVYNTMAAGRPIFTSIGNQIPPFAKPPPRYGRGSEWYVHETMLALIIDLNHKLRAWQQAGDTPVGIKTVVDWLSDWHRSSGIRRFLFVHTAFAMDLAEYHPHLVDPHSHCYFGANAKRCAALVFERARGMSTDSFHDAVIDRFRHDVKAMLPETPAFPMSLEDVLCDGIRWIRNYIPKGYEHLRPDQIESSAPDLLGRHPSYHQHLERHRDVHSAHSPV